MNGFTSCHYEFLIFPDATPLAEPLREITMHATLSAARARAGRLAKKYRGAVDLAHAGPKGGAWNERYITTANPSEYHAAGYRFGRLES